MGPVRDSLKIRSNLLKLVSWPSSDGRGPVSRQLTKARLTRDVREAKQDGNGPLKGKPERFKYANFVSLVRKGIWSEVIMFDEKYLNWIRENSSEGRGDRIPVPSKVKAFRLVRLEMEGGMTRREDGDGFPLKYKHRRSVHVNTKSQAEGSAVKSPTDLFR